MKTIRYIYLYRVYDPDSRKFVQTNVGHSDSVRSIIHVPERGQVCLNLSSVQ